MSSTMNNSKSESGQNSVRVNILTEAQRITAKQIFDHLTRETTKSILLHCHPNPDPDSLGSVLAMKFALESIGKNVSVIAGDSKTPSAFNHFPGATEIIPQNYFEIDLTKFDTFLILDSGSPSMVSRKDTVVFPPQVNPDLKTVVIDHHASNEGYGDINLVATQYVSTTEIVFDLLQEWSVSLTKEIATNLYVGLFTDGGGFRYDRISDHSFYMAGILYSYNPEMLKVVDLLENSSTPKSVDFLGLALTQKKVCNIGTNTGTGKDKGSFVISYISYEDVLRLGLTSDDIGGSNIVNHILKAVVGWNVTVILIETNPGEVKCSFRTRDQVEFDVSKVALALGGGGHKAAAGATVKMPISEAVEHVERAIREVLFG
jgi:bifunctional oligoribonuclease and PAP phosphatase NrnA